MTNIYTRAFGKLVLGASLSFTIALTAGTMFANSNSAYAATATTSASVSAADKAISVGKQFIGVPYKYGAVAGRTDVFDCSSFTQYVFKQAGIELPRSSKQQSKSGTYVSKDQLQPGDLVFSDTNKDGVINHVSLYIGDGKLLHTYRVGIGVTISDFKGSTWDRTYVTARRVIPSNGTTNIGKTAEVTTPVDTTNTDTNTNTNTNKDGTNDSNNNGKTANDFFSEWNLARFWN